jgi:DNA-binding XRE family transcriptional regulator
MHHTEETKNRFIELRAIGLSLDKIAAEIGVTKKTLWEWGKEFEDEIADLRVLAREHLKEKLLGNTEQWCGRLVIHFNRLDEEFGRRKLQYSPTESVFRMMLSARDKITKELFTDSPPATRQKPPVEPAQEENQ